MRTTILIDDWRSRDYLTAHTFKIIFFSFFKSRSVFCIYYFILFVLNIASYSIVGILWSEFWAISLRLCTRGLFVQHRWGKHGSFGQWNTWLQNRYLLYNCIIMFTIIIFTIILFTITSWYLQFNFIWKRF